MRVLTTATRTFWRLPICSMTTMTPKARIWSNPSYRPKREFKTRAGEIYAEYSGRYKRRFKWLRSSLFIKGLQKDLLGDAHALFGVLRKAGAWNPKLDTKLDALFALLTKKHAKEKVIVFTQFADTVYYLENQLKARGLASMEGVTGDSADPTALAWRFSPVSNNKRERIKPEDELRVIIATDVLSEGQNLQDAAIVINYDLPWAIIRLIQRVGRVDRIGQKAEKFSVILFFLRTAWTGSSGCARGCASVFGRMPRLSERTKPFSKMTRTIRQSSISTTKRPACWTAMPSQKSI